MSWVASHLVVWPNSTSNAFPVGDQVPSGMVMFSVKVPVAWADGLAAVDLGAERGPRSVQKC